jgi:hypothetical protein
VAICEKNEERVRAITERYPFADVFHGFEEALASDYDAVHLVSGIPDHARQALATLNSGKHCACTVPMATSVEDLHTIVEAQRRSGRNYMMMETAVYTRQFLYAQELKRQGRFGRIQFLRGAHYQDMERWPSYWAGLPPMWYATHAVSPLLAIAETRTWFTSLCAASSKRGAPGSTRGWPPTGPLSASAPTSRPCTVERPWTSRALAHDSVNHKLNSKAVQRRRLWHEGGLLANGEGLPVTTVVVSRFGVRGGAKLRREADQECGTPCLLTPLCRGCQFLSVGR